jgi:peptide/nickel transport system substrate-binding protein
MLVRSKSFVSGRLLVSVLAKRSEKMLARKWIWIVIVLLLALVACNNGNVTDDAATPTAVVEAPQPAATEEPAPAPTAAAPTAAPAADTESAAIEAEPVTLHIGWPEKPDTLNPAMAQLSSSNILFGLVYDTMYELALDGSTSPGLVESVNVSPDGLVWTFTIGAGFMFHDGQPLTAADVAFTYNLTRDHAEFWTSQYVVFFEGVTAPDDRTVVIALTEVIPNLESQLAWIRILPEHVWSQLGEGEAAEFDNAAMIGSGPFRLMEYVGGERVRLAAVGSHPLATPQTDEIVFHTFENTEEMVEALRAGQVDLITEVPAAAMDALRADADIELAIGQPLLPSVADIILNQMAPENCPPDDGICSGHPALADRNVRLALAHATDKQGLIETILGGQGTPGRTLIPEGLGIWFNNNLVDYPFDIARANEILETAGYLDQDGDGIRETPDGLPLTFRIYWPDDVPTAPLLAEALAESWGEIGIAFSAMEGLDFDNLLGACCPSFDFDVILWSWSTAADPGFMLMVMTSDQIPTGWNETGYANPAYDALYARQATTLDQEERIAIVHQMQQIVFDDIVYIIPYSPLAVQAYRSDRFTGWLTNEVKVALETRNSLVVVSPAR